MKCIVFLQDGRKMKFKGYASYNVNWLIIKNKTHNIIGCFRVEQTAGYYNVR